MQDPSSLEKIYTLAEASERLRLNKNALARIVRRTGHCSVAGRTVLFSEGDLKAIWDAIRVQKSEPRIAVRATIDIAPRDEAKRMNDVLDFLGRPRILVDRRVIRVMHCLSKQRLPQTHLQIPDCGPRTIELLLRRELVVKAGEDMAGRPKVKLTPAGQKQVKNYEEWLAKPKKPGR